MNEPLETLYALLASGRQSEEEARALGAAESAVLAAQRRLTPREFEDLWNALMDIGAANCRDSFTQGFRLGVQLILEGLRQS